MSESIREKREESDVPQADSWQFQDQADTLLGPPERVSESTIQELNDDDRPESKTESARRRDRTILTIVQTYKDHPTMPARTGRFHHPVDSTTLSLESRRRFFQEMVQYELLSVDDEKELVAQIDAGVSLYERRAGISSPDKAEEEVFLQAAAAHEMLILSNLRLVAKIAHRYVWLNAMPLVDLMAEGVIGLGTAVRRFDSARNGKLSTFATWWIRSNITRAIRDRGRLIRVPAWLHEKVTHFYRMTSTLANELERNPTAEDLAEAYGDIDQEELAEMQRIHGLIPDSLNRLLVNEDKELESLVAGSDDEALREQEERRELVQQVLADNRLTDNEREVMRLRYGLDDGRARTLEEVGKQLKVTRERIRQIEASALRKMRRRLGLPYGDDTGENVRHSPNMPTAKHTNGVHS